MSTVGQLLPLYEFNRGRTLKLLDDIAQSPAPQEMLGFRPGKGRAHIAWQVMHIGVTEEIFATERLAPHKPGAFRELWDRFRGGSTPDDDIPSLDLIRQVLSDSRAHLLETLRDYPDSRLSEVPDSLKARNLSVSAVLSIIAWHEAHHHGQAHLTVNLFKNRGG